jgi:hypothetical protein
MTQTYRYVQDLATAVEHDSNLKSQVAADPAATLRSLQEPIPDTGVYRILIAILGLAVLIALIGPLVLAGMGKQDAIPQSAIAIGSTAIGALAGLLAPSPGQNKA